MDELGGQYNEDGVYLTAKQLDRLRLQDESDSENEDEEQKYYVRKNDKSLTDSDDPDAYEREVTLEIHINPGIKHAKQQL